MNINCILFWHDWDLKTVKLPNGEKIVVRICKRNGCNRLEKGDEWGWTTNLTQEEREYATKR